MRKIGLKLFLMVLGIFLSLGLGELLLRGIFYRSKDFDMEMWKYATSVKSLEAGSAQGYRHLPLAREFLMGVEIETNNLGFREHETTLDKTPGVFRILVLGDSITLGWGVRQEETFSTVLENLLNTEAKREDFPDRKFEVLNLGVGNFNTDLELKLFKEVGLSLNPDLVLIAFYLNDAEVTPRPDKGFLIQHSYLFAFILSRINNIGFGRMAVSNSAHFHGLYQETQPGWKATQKALQEFEEISVARSIPMVLMLVPDIRDLRGDYPFALIHRQIVEYARKIGMTVFDLTGYFKNVTDEKSLWVTSNDPHPNAAAHSILGKALFDTLITIPAMLSAR